MEASLACQEGKKRQLQTCTVGVWSLWQPKTGGSDHRETRPGEPPEGVAQDKAGKGAVDHHLAQIVGVPGTGGVLSY